MLSECVPLFSLMPSSVQQQHCKRPSAYCAAAQRSLSSSSMLLLLLLFPMLQHIYCETGTTSAGTVLLMSSGVKGIAADRSCCQGYQHLQ